MTTSLLKMVVDGIRLKTNMDVLKDIVTDTHLRFEQDGLHIRAQDPDKMTMVKFWLPTTAALSYHIDGTAHFVGVNVPHFYKLIRSVQPGAQITMEIEKDTPSILKLVTAYPTSSSAISIKSMDMEPQDVVFSETVYESMCEIPTHLLQKLLRDAALQSKKVGIRAIVSENVDEPKLIFTASGELSTTSVTLAEIKDTINITNAGIHWGYHGDTDYSAQFWVKHLLKFLKPSLCKNVCMHFRVDQPILLSYTEHFCETSVLLSIHVAPILGTSTT